MGTWTPGPDATSGDDTYTADSSGGYANGGDGDDTLNGAEGNDNLEGGPGDDVLNGGAGFDTFRFNSFTGEGVDTVDGGDGFDNLYFQDSTAITGVNVSFAGFGSSGSLPGGGTYQNIEQFSFNGTPYDDIIVGSDLPNSFSGQNGDDTLIGGAANDSFTGWFGADTMIGNGGDDIFSLFDEAFGSGADTIDGGDGIDTLHYGSLTTTAKVLSFQGAGTSGILADGSSYQSIERISMTGSSQDDTLTGSDLGGSIYGGAGSDLISGGSSADTIHGLGTWWTVDGPIDGDDIISAGGGNDVVRGDGGNDTIYGGDGADQLYGDSGYSNPGSNPGNDTIYGGAGNDIIWGDEGDDLLIGEAGNDTISGGLGTDVAAYVQSIDNYEITFSGSAIFVTGPDGTDTVSGVEILRFAGVDYAVTSNGQGFELTGDENPNVISGGTGNDMISGLGGDDVLSGEGGNDDIFGGEGNDEINGGAGSDQLSGGPGDDVFIDPDLGDTVDGGDGVDTIRLTSASANQTKYVSFDLGNGPIDYITSVERIQWDTAAGETSFPYFFGDAAGIANFLSAGGAGLEFVPGDGYETLWLYVYNNLGPQTIDLSALPHDASLFSDRPLLGRLYGGDGMPDNRFVISASNISSGFAFNVTGSEYDEDIFGGNESDFLVGGAGNDIISGRGGNDQMYGGEGNDYIYANALGGNAGGDYSNEAWDGGGGTDFIGFADTLDLRDGKAGRIVSIEGVAFDVNAERLLLDTAVLADLATALQVEGNNTTYDLTIEIDLASGESLDLSPWEFREWETQKDFVLINGADGAETVTSSAGSDYFIGGAGSDTFVLTGARADYKVTQGIDGSVVIRDLRDGNPDGVDLVDGVETLQFSDGAFATDDIAANGFLKVSSIPASADPDLWYTFVNGFAIGPSGAISGSWDYLLYPASGYDGAVVGNVFGPEQVGPVDVDRTDVPEQDYPYGITTAALADGRFMYVWFDLDFENEEHAILARIVDPSAPNVVQDFVIAFDASDSFPFGSDLAIEELADGRVVVVWDEYHTTLKHHVGKIIDLSDPEAGLPFLLQEVPGFLGRNFAVQALPDGTFFYVGSRHNGSNYEVVGGIVDPNAPETASNSVILADGFARSNSLDLLPDGRIVMVIDRTNTAGRDVLEAVIFDPASPDSMDTILLHQDYQGDGYIGSANVEVLPDGKLAFAWSYEDTTAGNTIWTRVLDPNDPEASDNQRVEGLKPDEFYTITSSSLLTFPNGTLALAVETSGDDSFTDDIFVTYFNLPTGPLTLAGTARGDAMSGSDFADTLSGLDGNDLFFGGGGADVLDGGNGMDGAAYTFAPEGLTAHLLHPHVNTGDALGDTYISIENLTGSAFSDFLAGDDNANRIVGGDGDDQLYGLGGADTLLGGSGSDRLEGGDGFDLAAHWDATAGVTAHLLYSFVNAGDAAGDMYFSIEGLIGSNFDDLLAGDDVFNVLVGLGGADRLYGLAGDDELRGNAGADLLEGGLGADLLDGGDGVDMARHDNATGGVLAHLQYSYLNTGEAAGDTYISIEGLAGSPFDDFLAGDLGGNELQGLAGNDRLYGLDGADQLFGGDGVDFLEGGSGGDLIDGGAGYDFARHDNATGGVTAHLLYSFVNEGDAAGDTYVGIEGLVGSYFGDFLAGDGGSNEIYGLGGADRIYGLDGGDLLYGDDGDDFLEGGAGGDLIDGGAGFDMARHDNATAGVQAHLQYAFVNLGDAAGDAYVSIEGLAGSTFGDFLAGNEVDNRIEGLAGNDSLYGLTGHDQLFGGDGADFLEGGAGNDLLDGGAGFDFARHDNATSGVTANLASSWVNAGDAAGDAYVSIEGLVGSYYADTLVGDGASNEIYGLSGDDAIYGLGGADQLFGDGGADTFHFFAGDSVTGAEDVLRDFQSGTDRIDLTALRTGASDTVAIIDQGGGVFRINHDQGGDGSIETSILTVGAVTLGDIILTTPPPSPAMFGEPERADEDDLDMGTAAGTMMFGAAEAFGFGASGLAGATGGWNFNPFTQLNLTQDAEIAA